MLVGYKNIYPVSNNLSIQNNNKHNNMLYSVPLSQDTVNFTGMSKPSQYSNVFEYLAAKILFNKPNLIEEEKLSANNIQKGVEEVFDFNGVYGPYTKTLSSKIKWKPYVPQDIREYSAQKVNEARIARLNEWKQVLEAPEHVTSLEDNSKLIEKLKKNKSLRIVIWNAVNSELKDNNRHIPVPFNAQALSQTIDDFEAIEPKFRKVRCAGPSFLEMYTHRLRDSILEEKGVTDEKSVWIKIPSIKHDFLNKNKNISDVEILSFKNWCTRSSVDKAEDVLKDGDFYIYLERGKNDLWQPTIGMATYQNKVNQIQGQDNNNVVPIKHLATIKKFLKENNLKCNSGIEDEGPKAYQQILISEKLAETREDLGKSFEKALKEQDSYSIFKYINKDVNKLDDETLSISDYKPYYLADSKKGITIPYNMMGIDEDTLLQNVSKINGDMILDNKNVVYNSSLSVFPPNLKEVTGKISCTKEQYEKFGNDLNRVIKNKSNIIIH